MKHTKASSSRPRRIGRFIFRSLAICALVGVGTASAEWRVQDQKARDHLDNIKKQIGGSSSETVSGRLVKIHNQQQVGGNKYNPTTKRSLNPYSDSQYQYKTEFPARAEDKGMAQRCPDETQNPAKAAQTQICKDIVKWENRKYNYMIEMLKVSKEREEELKRIYDERNGITADQPGRLQSNTNRLLALQAHQQIDAINSKAMMDGYEALLGGLNEDLKYEARKAMDGKAAEGGGLSWGSLAGAFTQSVALEVALQGARTAHER